MRKFIAILGFLFLSATAQGQMKATATPHGTSLSWTATTTVCTSPCTSITYNVYRGTTSGGEDLTTPINSSPITGTTYTDSSVTLGTTYYYVVEAVEAWTGSPLVSAPSNEASVTFPQAPAAPSGLAGTPS